MPQQHRLGLDDFVRIALDADRRRWTREVGDARWMSYSNNATAGMQLVSSTRHYHKLNLEVTRYPRGEQSPAQAQSALELQRRLFIAARRQGWANVSVGVELGYKPMFNDDVHYMFNSSASPTSLATAPRCMTCSSAAVNPPTASPPAASPPKNVDNGEDIRSRRGERRCRPRVHRQRLAGA